MEPFAIGYQTLVYIEAKKVSRVYFGNGFVGKKGDDTHQQPTAVHNPVKRL